MELVTLDFRLQNLGALDKEDPFTGVFFLSTVFLRFSKLVSNDAHYSHAALVA